MTKGDQIYTIRDVWNTQNVYEHYGIDCGDGTVIHYQKMGEPEIVRASLSDFVADRIVYIRHHLICFAPDIVVERAESRLGERKYNFFFNNCEHFANWCKTGRSFSGQPAKHTYKLWWVFVDWLR
jgi:hypothetical protein